MLTLERPSWSERASLLLVDMAGLVGGLESRMSKNIPLEGMITNISQARLLIEMGWFHWSQKDNWRRDAVSLLSSTNCTYTLADPHVPKLPKFLPEKDGDMAVGVLEILSSYEAALSVLLNDIPQLPDITMLTASEVSRLYHGAREQLIFATLPLFNYVQAMAFPVSADKQVSTIIGEA